MIKVSTLHLFTLAGFDLLPGALYDNRPAIQQEIINDLLYSGLIEIKRNKYRPTEKGSQYLIEFRILIQREMLTS